MAIVTNLRRLLRGRPLPLGSRHAFSTASASPFPPFYNRHIRTSKFGHLRAFDQLVESQKPLRRLIRVKNHLAASNRRRALPVSELGRRLELASVCKERRLLPYLLQYPSVFKVTQDPTLLQPFVEFADPAKEYLQEEDAVRAWYEPILVETLCKLLALCTDCRMRMDHLCLLEEELVLPPSFEKKICRGYPQFFRVVEEDQLRYLELNTDEAGGDFSAMTAREKQAQVEPVLDKAKRPLPYGFHVYEPSTYRLSVKKKEALERLQRAPFRSPYEHVEWVDPKSLEREKRAMAFIHEFLSLTVEKRTTAQRLEVFRRHVDLPHNLPSFLQEHFELFYVTQKGELNTVFLIEAYDQIEHRTQVARLIHKGPLVLMNELFGQLMPQIKKGGEIQANDNGNPLG